MLGKGCAACSKSGGTFGSRFVPRRSTECRERLVYDQRSEKWEKRELGEVLKLRSHGDCIAVFPRIWIDLLIAVFSRICIDLLICEHKGLARNEMVGGG